MQQQLLITVIIVYIGIVLAEPYPKTEDGYFIGELSDAQHKGIKGKVYFIDSTHILVKKFKYTYPAPDMFFWLDKGKISPDGTKVPSPKQGENHLASDYVDEDVSLTVPAGKSLKDFDIFGLYCLKYSVNFGQVEYDKNRLPF